MDDVILARTLHVLAVVIWIGGVSMATTVALPAIRRGDLGADRLAAFHAFERRFIWQARTTIVLVGLTGFYMVARLDLWSRFQEAAFWWMHAMVCLWLLFLFVVFVGEPLILHRKLPVWTARDPHRAFTRMIRLHWVLLVLALITIAGAVAGSQGWSPFP